jgi:hypothetical protein
VSGEGDVAPKETNLKELGGREQSKEVYYNNNHDHVMVISTPDTSALQTGDTATGIQH